MFQTLSEYVKWDAQVTLKLIHLNILKLQYSIDPRLGKYLGKNGSISSSFSYVNNNIVIYGSKAGKWIFM